MKRILYLVFIASILVSALAAQTKVEPFFMVAPRMAALGGAHAASVNGVDAIFENPAGFARNESELSFSALLLRPSGPIFDIAGIIAGGGDALNSISNLFDNNGRLYVSSDILGPVAFAYAGKGLGFGIYNKTSIVLNASSITSIKYAVTEEVILTGGYAYRLELPAKQLLDMGIMPKGLIRGSMGKSASLTDVMDLVSDPASILNSPFSMTTSLGFDVGLLWSYDNFFSLGLVMRDAYSPALINTYENYSEFLNNPSSADKNWAIVKPDLAFGLCYEPKFDFLNAIGAKVKFLLDYADITDLFSTLARNPILNIKFGTELVLLDILSLRAGISDALPTAGFGIDLEAFTFSLAMYGKELGKEPGARPLFNMIAGFEFRY